MNAFTSTQDPENEWNSEPDWIIASTLFHILPSNILTLYIMENQFLALIFRTSTNTFE